MISLLAIPYMAWFSRVCGGGWPKISYGLDSWLLPLPYLIFTTQLGLWIVPAYLCAVLGIRLGHGRGFHYNLPFKPDSKPEKIEAIIPDFLPVYWQKFLIMALTGVAVTVVLGISLFACGHILAGIVVLLSGLLKSVCYLTPQTEESEYLRGAALGLGFALSYYLISASFAAIP